MSGGAPSPCPQEDNVRLKDAVRIAYECGFLWAADVVTVDPVVPPDRDTVVLTLTEAQAESVLFLQPETWWKAWARGWVAGLDAREGVCRADPA